MTTVSPLPDDRLLKGQCWVFVALDLGFSIDLAHCVRLVSPTYESSTFRHNRKAPLYFGYDHPPAVLTQGLEPLSVGPFRTQENVTVTIYDSGAISVSYIIPFHCDKAQIISLSDQLYDNKTLADDAKARASTLLSTIGPAVKRPHLASSFESYVVFELEEYPYSNKPQQYVDANKQLIAQILGSETDELSQEQVDELLSSKVSYYGDDLAVITWNASLLFGKELGDIRAVLEQANVQLLELVHLDRQLDRDLDEAYIAGEDPSHVGEGMRRIGTLMLDGQLLNESISNALKLIGDPFLARVYSIAAKRFGLSGWSSNIDSKLQILYRIYTTLADRMVHKRAERLELTIIFLILLEIILSLVLPK